jgi:tetratricopeptide (TPR) repeat protein
MSGEEEGLVVPRRLQTSPPFALAACLILLSFALLAGCAAGPPLTPTELGEAALMQGNWPVARAHFAQALRLDARDAQAWQGQARAELSERDPEAALRSLSRLAAVDPERFQNEARALYGESLAAATEQRLARRQSEAALVAVRALVRVEPERRGLDRLLGRALLAEAERRRLQGERQTALQLYREACEVTPGALEAWVATAEILLEKRKGKEAIRVLKAARAHHPTASALRLLTRQALKAR